jgi:hypothetical protein
MEANNRALVITTIHENGSSWISNNCPVMAPQADVFISAVDTHSSSQIIIII